jgi:hypothetical protein
MRLSTFALGTALLLSSLAGCSKSSSAPDSDGGAASTGSAANGAVAAASAPAASSSAKPDPDACGPNDKAPVLKYADVPFKWSQTPTLADAPKDKSYASVGGKPFELSKVEIWVSEANGDFSLRTNDGEMMGPSLTFKGVPKAGAAISEKWAYNHGYFQVPKKGDTIQCSRQTTSYNGDHATQFKLTRYDGKTADGSFVTTWEWDQHAEGKRQFWAGGTFKDAKVVVFKK